MSLRCGSGEGCANPADVGSWLCAEKHLPDFIRRGLSLGVPQRCAEGDCRAAAEKGPWCGQHRPRGTRAARDAWEQKSVDVVVARLPERLAATANPLLADSVARDFNMSGKSRVFRRAVEIATAAGTIHESSGRLVAGPSPDPAAPLLDYRAHLRARRAAQGEAGRRDYGVRPLVRHLPHPLGSRQGEVRLSGSAPRRASPRERARGHLLPRVERSPWAPGLLGVAQPV